MEESKGNASRNKGRRKKIVVSGVGGIAGVLIFGGAFVIENLMRNKASKKKIPDTSNPKLPTSPIQKPKSFNNNIEEGSEGLRSLLQTSSPLVESPHSCSCRRIEHDASRITMAQIDDYHTESKTFKSRIMEDILAIEVNVRKNISSCGNQKIESGSSNEDYRIPLTSCEEISKLDNDKGSLTCDSMKKEDQAGSLSVIAEGNLPDIARITPSQQNPSLALKEDIEDEEGTEERETRSSEGTSDSSTESNSEAIWPAGHIEEQLLFKDWAHVQILEEKVDREISNEFEVEGGFEIMCSLATGFKFLRHPSLISTRLGFWLWLSLALGLLLLLFAPHLHRSCLPVPPCDL